MPRMLSLADRLPTTVLSDFLSAGKTTRLGRDTETQATEHGLTCQQLRQALFWNQARQAICAPFADRHVNKTTVLLTPRGDRFRPYPAVRKVCSPAVQLT
jgi:hypothetical protein